MNTVRFTLVGVGSSLVLFDLLLRQVVLSGPVLRDVSLAELVASLPTITPLILFGAPSAGFTLWQLVAALVLVASSCSGVTCQRMRALRACARVVSALLALPAAFTIVLLSKFAVNAWKTDSLSVEVIQFGILGHLGAYVWLLATLGSGEERGAASRAW